MSNGGKTCLWVCLWPGLGQTDGWTPLFVASAQGHVGVVDALVKAKAALNQADVCDRVPSIAAGRVRCACVSLG